MKLYEIINKLENCIKIDDGALDQETGEIIDFEALEALEIARDEKIENIACWVKNLKAESEALKAEKQKLEKRQKTAENKQESLKSYLALVLQGEKFKTAKAEISFRKAESVVIQDGAKIPEEYLVPQPPKEDKRKLKEAITNGAEIRGVTLLTKQNIQIK